MEMDDEILQDFLVEAGEILEQLDSQLVALEGSPGDSDLLNAVFRGFHTIKGGAGFLGVQNLVAVSHKSEDIFDLLRKGSLAVDAQLMDVFLQVLDVLRTMFEDLSGGQEPGPAPAALMACLVAYASGGSAPTPAPSEAAPEPDADDSLMNRIVEEMSAPAAVEPSPSAVAEAAEGNPDLITEDEFEALLDKRDAAAKSAGQAAAPASAAAADADLITEEEFDALLDKLDAGKKSAAPAATTPAENGGDDGLITEDEFDALLDKLDAAKRRVAAQPAAAPEEAAEAESELITEAEFDALLDKLDATRARPRADSGQDAEAEGELITDEEFEAVLDRLHGKGQFAAAPASASAPGAAAPAAPVPSVPVPAPVESPAPVAASAAPRAPAKPKVEEGGAKTAAPKDTTVRVETEVLDRIMNMVGELVLIRNRLTTLQSAVHDEAVLQTISNLDVVTSDLQTAAMKTRMQPIKKVFGRFPRVVRDLARSLSKEIDLKMTGEETDLDKNLVEALADPLVHLVRNSIDHGIEVPAERIAAGKPAKGTLELSAEQVGDQIELCIKDDGKGIDADALRRKAVASGLLEEDAASRLSARECFELIFLPGFSTKQEISDISGRGVGMDVVKTRITQLNGTISIESALGIGTTIRISVPLTLAIMPTLMVVLGAQVFALPLVNVQEIIGFRPQQSRDVDGRKTLIVRGRAIPLFYLSRWLVRGASEFGREKGHVVVVRIGSQNVGLLVDELIGQEEVVIKPLGALLHGTKGLAGATITGDGKIALIIDLPDLIEHYARR